MFFPIRLAAKLIRLIVLAAIVYVLFSTVQVVLASRLSTNAAAVATASAIVVIQHEPAVTTPAEKASTTAQLSSAAALYRAGRSTEVIVSANAASQANAAMRTLTGEGVPSTSIHTVVAADFLTALTRVAGIVGKEPHVILVVDAVDALSAKSLASARGLTAEIAPSLGSEHSFYTELGAVFEQGSAVAAARIVGWSRVSWGQP